MDGSVKGIVIMSAVVLLLGTGLVGGCTYVVSENNRQYYETMQQCISSGGTFVPTRGDASSAACIRR
jgi:hypothetical protein